MKLKTENPWIEAFEANGFKPTDFQFEKCTEAQIMRNSVYKFVKRFGINCSIRSKKNPNGGLTVTLFKKSQWE